MDENNATNYFFNYVTPNYKDWMDKHTDLRIAMNLAGSLNNMVDYYWYDLSGVEPQKVLKATNQSQFRKKLSHINSDIALIRDIADSHKHLKLNRKDKLLTNASQIEGQQIGYGQGYGLSYGGGEQLVVNLDDSSEKYFYVIAKNVYEYWNLKVSEIT